VLAAIARIFYCVPADFLDEAGVHLRAERLWEIVLSNVSMRR
jgi:hypothetical protein